MEHHERLRFGGIDRPDRARHMRERRAVEDVRVGFQLLEDDLPVSDLLLVERPVGAYVGDERHGGIVRRGSPRINGARYFGCLHGYN